MTWPGAPTATLERQGLPFRPVDEVLGPPGLAAADDAARTWARVWGLLPLADGKSFRELVEWREVSLLWSATRFLLEETAGPRCARAAERALRLLEATAPAEVDAAGLDPADALLLARACTARGVLFHGRTRDEGRPFPVARPSRPSGLRQLVGAALAPAAPRLPAPLAGAGRAAPPILALFGGEEDRDALASVLTSVSDGLGAPVTAVGLAELPRFETRRARHAIAEAEALLGEQLSRLAGTPGLVASYTHRAVPFSDLAAGDLEALLRGALPAAARRIEAARELLATARPAAVLIAVDGRDERRALLHACRSLGFGAVVVRREAAGEKERADGGPQPVALCDWEPGRDPGPVVAALHEAARGRVGAG